MVEEGRSRIVFIKVSILFLFIKISLALPDKPLRMEKGKEKLQVYFRRMTKCVFNFHSFSKKTHNAQEKIINLVVTLLYSNK